MCGLSPKSQINPYPNYFDNPYSDNVCPREVETGYHDI